MTGQIANIGAVPRLDEWFAQVWEFVQPALPPAPATVVEIGCGTAGGLVPRLRAAGYDATGVDPRAPAEPGYQLCEFERYDAGQAGAIIACTALHHVADLDRALDHVAASLRPGASLIVVEMAWERYDERTARWCFGQLAPADEDTWIRAQRDEFLESGQCWPDYLGAWAGELHRGEAISAGLDARFDRVTRQDAPYFFGDLAQLSAAREQAAIDDGQLNALAIRYLATARGS